MKGIILAGGTSSRLFPATQAVTKHLLPIYDKPMIYYPLSTVMLAGIRDILLITTREEQALYEKLLGNGQQWGINLTYRSQDKPGGLAEAFIVGESFIGDDDVCMMLGDNILYGQGLAHVLQDAAAHHGGATVFGYHVSDPGRYGVAEFDQKGRVISLEEKPVKPKSNVAIVGLYFYDNRCVEFAKRLTPSARGELEITDLSRLYLDEGALHVKMFGRGTAWLDTGTHSSMLDASNFIQVLEKRQGLKIGCPEEIAWRMGYINDQQLIDSAELLLKSGYGQYLLGLLEHRHECV